MNKIILLGVVVVLVGGGAFYGGTKYTSKSSNTQAGSNTQFNRQNFQDLTPEQRQQMIGQRGAGTGRQGQVGSGENYWANLRGCVWVVEGGDWEEGAGSYD